MSVSVPLGDAEAMRRRASASKSCRDALSKAMRSTASKVVVVQSGGGGGATRKFRGVRKRKAVSHPPRRVGKVVNLHEQSVGRAPAKKRQVNIRVGGKRQ
jgi:hypothetical protein